MAQCSKDNLYTDSYYDYGVIDATIVSIYADFDVEIIRLLFRQCNYIIRFRNCQGRTV